MIPGHSKAKIATAEVLEDVGLVLAMEEAEGSPFVSRDEVMRILDEPAD
jgi:hypothetical protein